MISLHLALADPAPLGVVERIREFFVAGGPFMILLGLTSVAGLAAVIYKILTLRSSRVIPEPMAAAVEKLGQMAKDDAVKSILAVESVMAEFERGTSTLARLCSRTMRFQGRTLSEINEAVQAMARAEMVRLNAGMPVIDMVISVAPMLGLLGTASGLVVVFSGLRQADADWVVITEGIGRALNTTIVGLVIAVPAIIAQGYFQRRIDTFAARLEVLLTQLAEVYARAEQSGARGAK